MTELNGITGYFAALGEPEEWEALGALGDSGQRWYSVTFWQHWDFFPCATTRWRRKGNMKTDIANNTAAELKGLEGYIAALREPEQWEVDNTIPGPHPTEWSDCWREWSSDMCSKPEHRWRRKVLVAEGEAPCVSGGKETRVYILLPNSFAGKIVRYRIEEVRNL